jgi:Sulfate permease family
VTGPTDHDQRETLGPEGPYADSPFKRARPAPLLERAVPVAGAIPSYRPPTARRDLTAGLTVAALAVPSAMAYAELAGLRPVAGLYALLLPTVAYALLGSSRQLIIGPEGSISALVAAAVLSLAAGGSQEAAELAAMLALLVGACFAVARFARLGWLADYFSRPVLIGYVHGVAVVLVIGQVGKLLGLDVSGIEPLDQLGEVVQELGEISWQTTVVGLVALSVLLPLRFVAPRVPAALLVSSARSSCRNGSTSQPTMSPSSARSHPGCRASTSPRQASSRRSSSRPPPSASFSSPSPTRSSPRARTPGSTSSTSTSVPSWWRWEPQMRLPD